MYLLFVCFFPAIFAIDNEISVGDTNHLLHKEATNQSLNQKSRCFYIGAFAFMYYAGKTSSELRSVMADEPSVRSGDIGGR